MIGRRACPPGQCLGNRRRRSGPMKKILIVASCSLLVAACASAPAPSGPSANAVMRPATGSQVHGNVTFTEIGNAVRVDAEIAALTAGLNTLRIHEKGD